MKKQLVTLLIGSKDTDRRLKEVQFLGSDFIRNSTAVFKSLTLLIGQSMNIDPKITLHPMRARK